MEYHIKRVKVPGGFDAYALVDSDGNLVGKQTEGVLRSAPGEVPTFTVTFLAGERGLQVLDERSDDV